MMKLWFGGGLASSSIWDEVMIWERLSFKQCMRWSYDLGAAQLQAVYEMKLWFGRGTASSSIWDEVMIMGKLWFGLASSSIWDEVMIWERLSFKQYMRWSYDLGEAQLQAVYEMKLWFGGGLASSSVWDEVMIWERLSFKQYMRWSYDLGAA